MSPSNQQPSGARRWHKSAQHNMNEIINNLCLITIGIILGLAIAHEIRNHTRP